MSRAPISLPQSLPQPQARSYLKTSRHDLWWVMPAITVIYFSAFIVYSTWAAWQGEHYFYAGKPAAAGGWESQYLSPMYSPVLWTTGQGKGVAPLEHAWLGEWPSWLPHSILGIIPLTGAFFILWMPGGFRFTCYYYRGAYYKAFWQDPTSCAIGEPSWRGTKYRGERWLPLTLQNVHRWFMYIALVFILILGYDAFQSFIFVSRDATTHEIVGHKFGVGVGSLVLTLNVILLGGYTLGCHSLRHLVGGKNDCVSSNPTRFKAWQCVTCLNSRHMQWAWISLFWVGFTDAYVRLCSMEVWSDWRIIGG